jgi:hypothetical protein
MQGEDMPVHAAAEDMEDDDEDSDDPEDED